MGLLSSVAFSVGFCPEGGGCPKGLCPPPLQPTLLAVTVSVFPFLPAAFPSEKYGFALVGRWLGAGGQMELFALHCYDVQCRPNIKYSFCHSLFIVQAEAECHHLPQSHNDYRPTALTASRDTNKLCFMGWAGWL